MDEGQKCPVCLNGVVHFPPVEGCSCHIAPPCNQCLDNELVCDHCGMNEDEIATAQQEAADG